MNRTEHLLACVSEECAEIIQAVDKALRFGLDDGHPNQNTTNAHDIIKEFHDLVGVLELLAEDGSLACWDAVNHEGESFREAIEKKKTKVSQYMEYAKSRGTVSD